MDILAFGWRTLCQACQGNTILISDWKGRNLTNAEVDQESRLRPDGDEAPRRARARRCLQRERHCWELRHSVRGVSEDSAATGKSGFIDFAARDERRIHAGSESGNDLRL